MKRDSVKKRVSFGDNVGEEANFSKSHSKKAKKVSETKSSDVSGESTSFTPDIKPKQEKLNEKHGENTSESDEDVKKSITMEVQKKLLPVSLPENLELFLKNRPNLTLSTPTKKHPDLKVYSEEEVFILQCHNSIKPEKLLGQKIYLKGRTEIEEDGLEFSVEKMSQGSSKTVTLVSSQERGHLTAETFPVVGKITLSQLIEEPIITYNASQDNSHEEFPANLKVRHPLLGADFEKTLSENIVVKQESPEVEVIQPSQRRSKRKRNREEEQTPSKKSPAKKKIKQEEISPDLQWLQDV